MRSIVDPRTTLEKRSWREAYVSQGAMYVTTHTEGCVLGKLVESDISHCQSRQRMRVKRCSRSRFLLVSALAFTLRFFALTRHASAQKALCLHMTEDSTCPETRALGPHLAARGFHLGDADCMDVDVRATTSPTGADAELVVRQGSSTATRSFTASTCADVLAAVEFTLTLALESASDGDSQPETPARPEGTTRAGGSLAPPRTPQPLAWAVGAGAGFLYGASTKAAATLDHDRRDLRCGGGRAYRRGREDREPRDPREVGGRFGGRRFGYVGDGKGRLARQGETKHGESTCKSTASKSVTDARGRSAHPASRSDYGAVAYAREPSTSKQSPSAAGHGVRIALS